MVKKILLTIGSIFLIFQSYKLLVNIHHLNIDSWVITIFIGWVINMFITGIFAFAGFAHSTQKLLPDSYYNIRNSKRLKKTYKLFKIDTFRKMLLATLWKNKDQRKRFFDGTKDGIANLDVQSRKSEFGHLIPLIILNIIGIYLFIINLPLLAISTLFFNIAGNFYPILLQRHHRMRIQILKRRQERKKV